MARLLASRSGMLNPFRTRVNTVENRIGGGGLAELVLSSQFWSSVRRRGRGLAWLFPRQAGEGGLLSSSSSSCAVH